MEKKRGKRSKPMDDGVWDCSVCTFKNSAEAFKCAMCDVRKGTSTRKPKPNPQLVAQQVVKQMAAPSKKPTSKRTAERVDLGSDTSQDSHRSEAREGDSSFSKASCSVQSLGHHLPQQQTVTTSSFLTVTPSTSHYEASVSKPPDDPTAVNGARVSHDTSTAASHVNFVALGRVNNHHYHQFSEPHNKSFSSVRHSISSSSSPNGSTNNGFAYPFYMDITVNGITVRIEEKDPKTIGPRPPSAQKMKRRRLASSFTQGTLANPTSPAANNRTSTVSDSSTVPEPGSERLADGTTMESTAPPPTGQTSSNETNNPLGPQQVLSTPSPLPASIVSQRPISDTSQDN